MNPTISSTTTLEQELFQNPDIAEKLKNDGVVKIPFLTPHELVLLQEYYAQLHGPNDPPTMYNGIHMTIWHSDLEYKLSVHHKLKELFHAACERAFSNYRAISHQFITKRKGEETTFPIHQDWAIVDENKYISLNLWFPLLDVSEKNGAMWIIKGSHRINQRIRGAGLLFPNYVKYIEQLKPYMTSFPMKTGEALIFYHSTIHGSPQNQSDTPRVVVQISILPKTAPLQIYFQKNENSPLEIHEPNDNFVFNYNKIREDSEVIPPTKNPTKELAPYSLPYKSIEDILDAIK
jgi:hypothetical protein